MGLRNDRDMGVCQYIPGKTGGLSSRMRRTRAAEGEKFSEYFVCCIEVIGKKRPVERPDLSVPLISTVGKRNPIEGIGEKSSYEGRLGRP